MKLTNIQFSEKEKYVRDKERGLEHRHRDPKTKALRDSMARDLGNYVAK